MTKPKMKTSIAITRNYIENAIRNQLISRFVQPNLKGNYTKFRLCDFEVYLTDQDVFDEDGWWSYDDLKIYAVYEKFSPKNKKRTVKKERVFF